MDKIPLVKQIIALQSKERNSLRHGKFEEIPALSQKKERLFAALSEVKETISDQSLRQIRDGAEANELLFQAALRGLKDAFNRIDEIKKTHDQLSTYAGDGSMKHRMNSASAVSVKA